METNFVAVPPCVAILIGASGSGKTKTLFDFSRIHFTLYFDFPGPRMLESSYCALDLVFLLQQLCQVPPAVLSKVEYAEYEELQEVFELLFLSRLVYLRWMKKAHGISPETWLLMQTTKTRHADNLLELFTFLLTAVNKYPSWRLDLWKMVKDGLFRSYSGGKIVICVDEAQHLFDHLQGLPLPFVLLLSAHWPIKFI